MRSCSLITFVEEKRLLPLDKGIFLQFSGTSTNLITISCPWLPLIITKTNQPARATDIYINSHGIVENEKFSWNEKRKEKKNICLVVRRGMRAKSQQLKVSKEHNRDARKRSRKKKKCLVKLLMFNKVRIVVENKKNDDFFPTLVSFQKKKNKSQNSS